MTGFTAATLRTPRFVARRLRQEVDLQGPDWANAGNRSGKRLTNQGSVPRPWPLSREKQKSRKTQANPTTTILKKK